MERRELLKALMFGSLFSAVSEESFSKRAVIYRVRYSSNGERTRIVFDCSAEISRNSIKEI